MLVPPAGTAFHYFTFGTMSRRKEKVSRLHRYDTAVASTAQAAQRGAHTRVTRLAHVSPFSSIQPLSPCHCVFAAVYNTKTS